MMNESRRSNLGGLEELAKRAWSRSLRFRSGIVIVVAMVTLAIFGPFIAPYPSDGWGVVPPRAAERAGKPPSSEFLLGTDHLGRDILSRIMVGAWLALAQSLAVILVGLALGLLLGICAAYYRQAIETIVNYVAEVFLALPAIVLALALRMILGQGLHVVIGSLLLTWWPWYARVAYVYARSITEMDYVTLAKLAGVPTRKVLLKHVAVNVLPPVLVQAITDMGSVLLEAAAINFLGLGLPPDAPDWGIIVQNGFKYVISMPWISLFPGLFILLTALGFSMLGDSLREELDPKMRRRWRLWF